MAIADNLVAFWELEEASGTRADSKGANTLADNATVTRNTGVVGYSAEFVSANLEYLSCASNAALTMGDIDFTFQAWVRENPVSGYRSVIGKDADAPANSRDYDLDVNDTGYPRFYINGGGGGLLVTSTIQMDAGVFAHILAWHDAANDLLGISVNGESPVTAATSGAVPQTTEAEFRIGARVYSGNEQYFGGRIDQVGIWKRVLTSDERTWLYNSGNGRAYSEMGSGNQLTVNVYESTIVDEFNG